jgi:DNA-binding NtrC family response regulator
METAETTTTSREIETDRVLTLGSDDHVLLIDDDPLFCTLFKAAARSQNLRVDSYGSLADLGSIANIGKYQLVVADYYLPKVNGVEIAEYVEAFFKGTPVVLISAGIVNANTLVHRWPGSIRRFFLKNINIFKVIDEIKHILRQPKPS